MIENQSKLNKFVLYVSSIAIALFGILYSFGEVKAEIFYLTEDDIELYYPLTDSCNSAMDKGDNLTLLDAGGAEAISWVSNIFGGGLRVKGEGSTNTSKSSGCYGSMGSDVSFAEGQEFTYILTINNPVQPSSRAGLFYFYDNLAYFHITADGTATFVWTTGGSASWVATQAGVINFDQNNRKYQLVFRGTWSDTFGTGSDKELFVNGELLYQVQVGQWGQSRPDGTMLNARVGFESGSAYGYNGEIGEIIVLNTKIHDDDLEQLQINSLSDMLGGGSASLYWAGVGQQAPSSPDYWSVPVYYDFCDIYQDAEEVRLSLCLNTSPEGDCYDEGFPYKYLKQGIGAFQCSGLTYLEGNIHWPDNPSGQSLTPALTVTYYDESPQDVFKGGAFSYTLYSSGFENYILANISGSITLPLTSTSTPIGFVYDVSDYDWEDEYSKVCVYNLESQDIVTDQCVSLISASGLSSISLPTPPTDFDQPLAFVYIEDSTDIRLMSNAFTVIWGGGRSVWENNLLLGDDATSTNIFVNISKNWLDKLFNLFPFNFPNAIMTAWENSETATLTSDLQFLDMSEENGDLKGYFPKEWLGTTTNMEVDIFGADMIANGSDSAYTLFENFKKFTKWLQYFAFAFGLWLFAKRALNSLGHDKATDKLIN